MAWDDLEAELTELFEPEPQDDWTPPPTPPPEERKAEGRARYRLNRIRLRIQALARYHRGKDLSGLRGGPPPKLSPDEVLTIRAIFRTDPSARASDVAEHFNVSRETIWAIVHRRTWRGL